MARRWITLHALVAAVSAARLSAFAGIPAPGLEEIVVTANRDELDGTVDSASQGVVIAEQLENRPLLRAGEVLEVVPGLVVTQHSGDGKANQYFLRGFNLDHGTDFATRVDGIPVNMPTHAHGQGYSDLNFLIPEFVEQVQYKKGTYYAEEGNFSAAGAADIRYKHNLDQPLLVSLTGGEGGYFRTLLGSSSTLAGGDLLFGAEYSNNDGPWDLKEGYRKISALLKFSRSESRRGYSITAMGYDGHWHSTDQIPSRAVDEGLLDRFGAIDPTDGGATYRYSLSADWWQDLGPGKIQINAYGVAYKLDLLSNFTYDTDPVHGDQFEQFDNRNILGGTGTYQQPRSIFGREGTLNSGVQIRLDDISPVGLYRTEHRVRYATVRQDKVQQTSYSAYLSQGLRWTPWFRSELGVRGDFYAFDVHSSIGANSGSTGASIVSPKFSLIFGPWQKTEYFVNVGEGFHSNDARGTTITVDPNDGVTSAQKVDPLVRAVGGEVGLRSAIIPHVQLAASYWQLKFNSELLFTGDGGTTEPSRATARRGVELGAYYTPSQHLVLDADLAYSHARFTQYSPGGDRIPNAVESVASVGITYNSLTGMYGGTRLRYFGPAPLIEDNSVRSASTMLINLEAGYHFSAFVSFGFSVFNLLDRRDNDITYYYESQLPGEAVPVSDTHFHPVEPVTVRATLTMKL